MSPDQYERKEDPSKAMAAAFDVESIHCLAADQANSYSGCSSDDDVNWASLILSTWKPQDAKATANWTRRCA